VVRINGGIKLVTVVETHNCGTREWGTTVKSRTGTHRLPASKLEDVEKDELHDGEVPILQDCQTRHNLRHSRMPYSNEQREYCRATV
jgi:hypothetical protein